MPTGYKNPPAKVDPITGRHVCAKCGLNLMRPGQQLQYPNSGWCTACERKRARIRRQERWETGERPICRNHPFSIVSLSNWKNRGQLLCHACFVHETPTKHEQTKRKWQKNYAKYPHKRQMNNLRSVARYQRMKDSLGGIHF